MQDEELAYGLRSVAGPIVGPDRRVVAGVNLAVQARDWSTQRIVRELRPVVLETCAEISALLARRRRRGMTRRRSRLAKLHPRVARRRPARGLRRHRRRADVPRGRSCSARRRRRRASRGRSTRSCCSRGSARALQALGAAVRYETSLPDRAREIAILVVAVHWDSSVRVVRARGGRAAGRARPTTSWPRVRARR